MKIQVLHNYGGKLTGERRILPGTYEHDDERLFGLATYLVANGHAIGDVPLDTKTEVVTEAVYDPHDPTFHNKLMLQQGRIEAIIPVDKPIPKDILATPDYNDLSMDELRHLLTAYDKLEIDVVSDMEADWRTRKTEIIAWLESR